MMVPVQIQTGANMTKKILRLPAVKNKTGLSRSSIYSGISSKRFPAPIALGVRTVGWLETEIDAWIDQRIQKSRQGGEA